MPDKLAAFIVTYNPKVGHVTETVEELLRQGFEVAVVDNGSENVHELEVALPDSANLNALGENLGIAAALNRGMELSEAAGAAWALSLDQDSSVGPNLYAEYEKALSLPGAWALCPRIKRIGDDRARSDEPSCDMPESVVRCPTTGFLLSVAGWREVGGYDEWLFIDYVDYDMCQKIVLAGHSIWRVNSAYVTQELGRRHLNEPLYRLGALLRWEKLKNFSVTYEHSPLRNYYYVRNSLTYIHRYRESIDVGAERRLLVKWETKKLLLEGHKLEQLNAIRRGVRDYRRHRGEVSNDNH